MWPEVLTTSLIIVLVAMGSFGLGRLSKIEQLKAPLSIKGVNVGGAQAVSTVGPNTKGFVRESMVNKIASNEGFIVGSKTGKKYHFPWCAGAQQIKEENKVWFTNEAEAKAAGFTPAANCKGLSQ